MASNSSLKEKVLQVLKFASKALGAAFAGLFAKYLVFLVRYKFDQKKKKLPLPPGPTPLPVIGNLDVVLGEKTDENGNPQVHHALMKKAKTTFKNGLYGLWMGDYYTIVITKPEVAEEAFMTHKLESGYAPRGDLTTDRASNQSRGGAHVPSMYIMTDNGKGIAMSTGNYWRKVRGRLVKHITSKGAAEGHAQLIREEVESVCSEWLRKCHRGENIDNLRQQLKRESMNMAMRVLFGKRYGSNPPQDFEDLKYCVEWFFCNLSSGNPSDMLKFLRKLPNPFIEKAKDTAALRDRVLGNLIGEHKREWEQLRKEGKMSSRKDCRGMLDQFFFDQTEGFEAKDENGKYVRQYLTENETHVCVWDILFAMTDTTATTNEWLIYHLINNPKCQQKIHDELERVVGSERLPTLEDRENLPYLWACIKETMRIRLVSPVMAPHYVVDDMTLHDTTGKEYSIPRGTTVYLHGYSMALDEDLWDNPEEFNPDRWFSARNEGLDLYGQVRRKNVEHYKFIPFSLGPRMCPGYAFAKVAQFLQAATIVHSFKWKLSPQVRTDAKLSKYVNRGRLDITENWGLTIMPKEYGEYGAISADPRPISSISRPQPGDIDFGNTFLRRDKLQSIKLISKEPLSHDSALLRFALPDKTSVLGLPVGKHLKIYLPNIAGSEIGKWNGRDDPEAEKNEIDRAYTPTSGDEQLGYVDLVVKFYRSGEKARFPDGGKLSQQLDKLLVNDEIRVAGPFGRIEYLGGSEFKVGSKQTLRRKMVGMLAGGSGISPMYQVLRAALSDPEDETMFSLIYANQTEDDILLREELESLSALHPERFRLHYTVDRTSSDSWKYSTGFIDVPMLRSHMPPPDEDTLILMCGPPMMIEVEKTNLVSLGYSKDCQLTF